MPGMRRTTSSTAAATAALAARLAAVETQLAGLQQAQAATDASVAAAGAGSARPPSAFTPVRPGRRSTLDLQGALQVLAGVSLVCAHPQCSAARLQYPVSIAKTPSDFACTAGDTSMGLD